MDLGTMIVTLGADLTALQKIEPAINRVAQRFRTFGYLASTALTLPILAAGKAAFKMAEDFEFSIQKIVGLAGVAQSTVNDWEKQVLAMAPKVAKAPQELAEALYYIASSGIKGQKALDVLQISAKAASAGLGETKEVADLLTSALNAYAGTGLTAAKSADILVAAVREGKGEADAFASAMGQIVPIAAMLGVSFDQVAGGMAAITLTGSSAANAAVYLKGVFNSLLKATAGGESALKDMGTSYKELRNILKSGPTGLIDLMQKLRDLQMEYGEEAISDVLPNIRALTAYLSIAGKNFKYNSELMDRVTNSAGSLDNAWAAVSDTIKIKFDSAIAQAKVSLISLGKSVALAFLPVLEKWVAKLTELTDWFNSLSDAQKEHKLKIIAWIAAAGPLSLVISTLSYVIGGLIWGIKNLVGVAKWAVTAFQALRVVMATNPVGLMITAITGLAAAYLYLTGRIRRAKEMQDEFNGVTAGPKSTPLENTIYDITAELEKNNEIIDDNMRMLFAMTPEQLDQQKNLIDQRIAILNDQHVKLLQYQKDWIQDDAEYINRMKLLTSAESEVEAWGKKVGGDALLQARRWKSEVDEQRRLIKERISNREMWIQSQLKNNEEERKATIEQSNIVNKEVEAIRKAIEETQVIIKEREELDKAIKDAWKDLSEGKTYIANMSALFGASFDASKEKIELFRRVIEELAKTDLSKNDPALRKLVKDYNALEAQVGETSTIMKQFASEMEYVEMMRRASKEGKKFEFDVNESKLTIYKNALDDLIREYLRMQEVASKSGKSFAEYFKGQDLNVLNYYFAMLTKGIEESEKAIAAANRNREDESTLRFLRAQAEMFGGVNNQIEVLNHQLEVSERQLRKIGEEEGFSESFRKKAQEVNNLRDALRKLEDLRQLTFLEDMNNAFRDTEHVIGLLSGKIEILTNRMKDLSEAGKANTPEFKSLAKQIESLSLEKDAIGILSDSFADFFSITKDGFDNFGAFLDDWVENLLQGFQRLAAEKIAEKIIGALFGKENAAKERAAGSIALLGANAAVIASEATKAAAMISSAGATKLATVAAGQLAVAEAAAAAAWIPFPANIAAIVSSIQSVVATIAAGSAQVAAASAVGLKEGGVIPPGYPNDTFIAGLSSGEKVLPLRKDMEEQKTLVLAGDVRFEIEQDKLVGILKKATKKNSIY